MNSENNYLSNEELIIRSRYLRKSISDILDQISSLDGEMLQASKVKKKNTEAY